MTAELYGSVARLVRHREASTVVEYVYTRTADARQRNELVSEFYGPEYALFKSSAPQGSDSASLDALFAAHPEKRPLVLAALRSNAEALVAKQLVQHSIVHRILSLFLQHADEADRVSLAQSLNEQLVHILHTFDGARVAVHCVSLASAKDRKTIVKSFKSLVLKIASEQYGHVVLMRLFQVTDDTVLLHKSVLVELLGGLSSLLTSNKFFDQVLLHLIAPSSTYIPEHTRQLLAAPALHSKKDPALRQRELCAHLVVPLLQQLAADASSAATSLDTSVVLYEALCSAAVQLVADQSGSASTSVAAAGDSTTDNSKKATKKGKQAASEPTTTAAASSSPLSEAVTSVLTALAKLVPTALVDDGSVLHDFTGSRLLKKLIMPPPASTPVAAKSDSELSSKKQQQQQQHSASAPALALLSDRLAPSVLDQMRAQLFGWAMQKSSSFVVLALLDAPSTHSAAQRLLTSHRAALTKSAEKGSQIIAERLAASTDAPAAATPGRRIK